MVKEIVKLFAVFGIIGGIAVGPSLVKTDTDVFEPNLELPTVGTYENLIKLVEESDNSRNRYYGGIVIEDAVNISNFATAGSLKQEALTESKSDYSTTNVQVAGVDEADIIVFIVDGKEELNRNDFVIRDMLMKSGKKVILAVNKIDNEKSIVK
jgi:uncharacterized secreted protein with C-terminal beta-propeller domain